MAPPKTGQVTCYSTGQIICSLHNAHSPIPATMQAYKLRGTPSLIVIDRHGVVRLNHFGHMEDLQLGALIGALVYETVAASPTGVDKPDPAALG